MSKETYNILYLYNSPKALDELLELRKDEWKIERKRYVASEVWDDVEFIYKFVLNHNLRGKICGMQVHSVKFLDGEYSADDLNFVMSRVRG